MKSFYDHLEECEQCAVEGTDADFCELGQELLFEDRESLSKEWQYIGTRLRERQQLQREADANVAYYADGGPFEWLMGGKL